MSVPTLFFHNQNATPFPQILNSAVIHPNKSVPIQPSTVVPKILENSTKISTTSMIRPM